MTNEEAIELNKRTTFAHKFQLELDGFDKKVVKETSFPNFSTRLIKTGMGMHHFNSEKEILRADEMFTTFYYNAAPEVINWMNNGLPKTGKLTVFDNNDKPYIIFDLVGCHLKSVNFGIGTYESMDLQTLQISYSCLATPTVVS